jgi:ER-bound oxygenase mpaB/B'/Rubber oxygenase, catalytic domain
MPRSHVLDEIRSLDAERDHQRIVFLSTTHDFSFDTTRALEFALFRTFCVPSVSALLDRTGEFQNRAQRRYDDTDLIVSEMMEHGYDSDRGRAALRKMNSLHNQFEIANEDLLYVLSTFVFEPIRWNARHGWRPMIDAERRSHFYFWREVGRRMAIKHLPTTYEEFEQYNIAYERDHFRFEETNARVGGATRDMFLSWFPAFLRPLVRPGIYAMMDEPIRVAFGFPRASALVRGLTSFSLWLRARVLRILPHRKRPHLRTELMHRSHPRGYRIEDLGPPPETARQ